VWKIVGGGWEEGGEEEGKGERKRPVERASLSRRVDMWDDKWLCVEILLRRLPYEVRGELAFVISLSSVPYPSSIFHPFPFFILPLFLAIFYCLTQTHTPYFRQPINVFDCIMQSL
jgi:hypothetical protein